ncbi:helix-turn-helix domain-containing protein [Microbacterium karelineae]|uniref:helix-turn-helix domain-containing protein n=1 Tax=Microbacterium karelineae TaxID=2654283 RepID=UPI0018D38949|nr:GAF domain-containing protein [Microbacterium karelineae]
MTDMSRRTREDLLRILLDTATDIAALDDVEDVLQAIVRRTRTLLGTDMAYISFTDLERHETYIRQTDGVTTHGYRTLRQPLGTGVLGQIARGVAPYQTRDYLDDDHLTHIPEIDEIVRAEGVRAIMGVPLTVGGRALGALVVAERHPRAFTPEEISDVDSLGRHAAVALDKSMRFAELARTADDLAREKDHRAAQLEMISAMVSLDNELIGTMTEAPSVQRILAVGHRAIARDLELRDAEGSVVAATAEASFGGSASVPVTAGDELLGSLTAEPDVDETARALLERIAAHVALALLFLRAQDEADLRLQTEVLGDMLARPDAPREHLERWLRRWGISSGSALRVVVIEAPAAGREQRVRALRSVGDGVIIMAAHEDHICFATVDASWAERTAQLFASRGWVLRAGVAGPVDDVRLIADAHSRAQLAYGSVIALGRTGVADAADLGMLSALLDLSRRGELPASLTAPVDPLREYDASHGTSLVRTAFLFLESDGVVERVARLLHVHRNTIRQRLDRIARILGAGWDASPRRLEAHLALHVLAAREGGGSARR